MAEYSNTGRVMARKVGQMADSTAFTRSVPFKPRYLTEQQREAADRDTMKAYERWKAQRDARLARYSAIRLPAASELQHKDIIV